MAKEERFILEDILLRREAGEEPSRRLKMDKYHNGPKMDYGEAKPREPTTEIIVPGNPSQALRGPQAPDNAHQLRLLREFMSMDGQRREQ